MLNVVILIHNHILIQFYVCLQSMLVANMNELLKRRGEAEHSIKDLESLYTQTVVQSL